MPRSFFLVVDHQQRIDVMISHALDTSVPNHVAFTGDWVF